jgi:hypothetical protein
MASISPVDRRVMHCHESFSKTGWEFKGVKALECNERPGTERTAKSGVGTSQLGLYQADKE